MTDYEKELILERLDKLQLKLKVAGALMESTIKTCREACQAAMEELTRPLSKEEIEERDHAA